LSRICENLVKRVEQSKILTVHFWIDSICINQTDVYERSRQVALMPEIYAKCYDMLIWLGEPCEATKDWLSSLLTALGSLDASFTGISEFVKLSDKICSAPAGTKEYATGLLFRSPFEFRDLSFLLLSKMYYRPDGLALSYSCFRERWDKGPEACDAYHNLTLLSWFHRKWVIQEMAHTNSKSRHFQIANQRIAVERVSSVLNRMDPALRTPLLGSIGSARLLIQNLVMYRNNQCSDPHDHIYALLGISSDSAWLEVDYSVNVESLYIAVAKYYMENGDPLAILALSTAQRSLRSVPSWVPDWREPWDYRKDFRHDDLMRMILPQLADDWPTASSRSTQMDFLYNHIQKSLHFQAWIARNCTRRSAHDRLVCRTCRILRDPMEDREIEWTSVAPTSHELSLRWAAVIRKQFEESIEAEEVMCLFSCSAIGLVLTPVPMEEMDGEPMSYGLKSCLLVDEAASTDHWLTKILNEQDKEWVCIL